MVTKARSPNYPGFSLQKALDFARKVYTENHMHKASREVVAKALGYGGLNGKSATAIATLTKYGLLEELDGELRVTGDALTVIAEPPSSPERARTLVKLATKPALFAELAAAYPGAMPSEEILRAWLLRKGFLPSTVDLPIRAYRETMELAEAQKGLYNLVKLEAAAPLDPQLPEVGDLIQWESAGVLRMEAPRRVRAKVEDEGSWWVFVDGSETGIPMEEAVVYARSAEVSAKPPFLPLVAAPASLESGEREVASGKFGKSLNYRLLATGEIGAKELGKIIKLLEAQKDVLDDDDDPNDLA